MSSPSRPRGQTNGYQNFRGGGGSKIWRCRRPRRPGPPTLTAAVGRSFLEKFSTPLSHPDANSDKVAAISKQPRVRVGSEVELTQSALAEMVGVQRTRLRSPRASCHHWARSGAAESAIHISDRQTLEGSACECYRTVWQRAERFLLGASDQVTSPRLPR